MMSCILRGAALVALLLAPGLALAQSQQTFTVTVPSVPAQTFTDTGGNTWQLLVPNATNVGTLTFTPASVTPNYSVVGHSNFCSGTVSTCASAVLTGLTAGQVVVVTAEWCDGPLAGGIAQCTNGTPAGRTLSNIAQTAGTASTTCARATGVGGGHEANLNGTHDTFICQVTAGGGATFTSTLSGNVTNMFTYSDVATGLAANPDDGWGCHSASLSTTSVSLTCTGTTTIANELLYAFVVNSQANPLTPGSSWICTLAGCDNPLAEWKTSGASGVAQTATATVPSGTSEMSLMGLK